MDAYEPYARSPSSLTRAPARERDDYRASDSYRERCRSPDRRRDRRRSRSPDRDRYLPERLPRDDYYASRGYDDRIRDHRRSSPHAPQIDRWVPGMEAPPPPALLQNPLPDPMQKLESPVGFSWFADWWRGEQRIKEERERARTGTLPPRTRAERDRREDREAEKPKIQAAYDLYKANWQNNTSKTFVYCHKHEDWFRERYVPEVRGPFRKRLMGYRKGLFVLWVEDLGHGVFDNFTLEGIYKSESNGAGGVLEKEEGETTAAAEVMGVGDLLPSKGGDIRDPIASQPTLLIKTIAPSVTRDQLEAFAKEHLGEQGGGFQHLSLSDPNLAKKCHRMGWIILQPETEEAEMKDAGQDEEDGEADDERAKHEKKAITANKALKAIDGKPIEQERGNFIIHCGVHWSLGGSKRKSLWDLFSVPERITRDLELAIRVTRKFDNMLGENYLAVAQVEARVHHMSEMGQLQPSAGSKSPNGMDEYVDEEEGAVDEDDHDDEELVKKKKKLDMLVEYLRRVHNYCFFCVFESDSVHELTRKCPGGHLRRPRSSLTTHAKEIAKATVVGDPFPLKKGGGRADHPSNGVDAAVSAPILTEDGEMPGVESPVEDRKMTVPPPSTKSREQLLRAYNWVRIFEEKILQFLEPENVNIRKIGGVPLEAGVDEELNKFIKQEDLSKYRCKVPECTKLFKGPDFWRKHVEKRHSEWYERVRSEIQLVNAYVLDPARMAANRSDAASNGHFPVPNHPHSGPSRALSMNSVNTWGLTGPPGMIGGAQMPPAQMMWPGSGVSMSFAPMPNMSAMGMSGVGPMRNQGRPMHGGRMHPYSGRSGRFGGPRGAMGPGRLEGGAAAIGPPEATMGRRITSYEDLDAASSSKDVKGVEMDY